MPHTDVEENKPVSKTVNAFEKSSDLPEDWYKCADFTKSRHENINFHTLGKYREYVMIPNAILVIFTVLTGPLANFFYFESEWGVIITTFSLFAS